MSDKYLIDKMEWLRSLDPQNPEIDNPLDFLQKSESTNSLSSDSAYSSLESQLMLEKLSNNPLVRERLEWQTMLSSVLKGDIVRSEKTKLANRKPDEMLLDHTDLIWLELKAWLNGRTIEDQRKSLEYSKTTSDEVFNEILSYRHDDSTNNDTVLEEMKASFTKQILQSSWILEKFLQHER